MSTEKLQNTKVFFRTNFDTFEMVLVPKPILFST